MSKTQKRSAVNSDDPTVATDAENNRLRHSEGGVTTRDDKTDLGVPMLPGSPDEPVGPEDALGEGPKRGDYTGRLGGSSYNPHDGTVPQRPRAEDIGDVPGLKGGVETAPPNERDVREAPSPKK